MAPPPGPVFGKPIEPVVAFCIVLFILPMEMDAFEDLLTAIYRLVIFIFNLLPLMISSALMSLGFVIEFEREPGFWPYTFESSMEFGEAPNIDGLS